jgi:hypothetical protein
MIDRYTIKFGPAVSQKELEKKLQQTALLTDDDLKGMHRMKARIEIVADFEDLKKIAAMLKEIAQK